MITGTKKKGSKKEVVVVAAQQSLSSNAHLTLIKRKRVKKNQPSVAIFYESSVDRKPLIKRVRTAKKTLIIEAFEKVGGSVPKFVTEIFTNEEAVALEKGIIEKVIEVQSEEEATEPNILDTTEKVSSPSV